VIPATKFRSSTAMLIGGLLCAPWRAEADPVVFKNTSYIFGYVGL